MKNIPFYELPNIITIGRLNFDGDKTDFRLHSDETFFWGAKTKREYLAACKRIDKIGCQGDGWQVYGCYDVSSYEYWMKNQQEQNYIQITISFDNDTIPESEIPKISAAFDNAMAEADAIQTKYSFNPCTYS